jgi:hypothetical protein
MGSGHFLVSLVDYLSDQVITAMAEAQALVTFIDYVSPLIARIAAIRRTILRNAEERGWTIDQEQLDDRPRRTDVRDGPVGLESHPKRLARPCVVRWLALGRRVWLALCVSYV